MIKSKETKTFSAFSKETESYGQGCPDESR